MFWKSGETEKDPLVYGDKFSVSDPKQKMIDGNPLIIHAQSTFSSPSWTVNLPEYNRIEIEYSPATRIENYLNSLSQDQCTKLINQFGKMLEEL